MFRTLRRLFSVEPLVLVFAGSLVVSGCEPTATNTPTSIASEAQQSQQLVRELSSKNALVEDPALNAYVRGVVQRIERTRPPGAVPIQAYIVKDPDVNAFTPGGGYLFINAGMLAAMENEAQLATVIAHEIGHIDRGHVQAAQSRRTGVQLGAAAAQIGGALLGIDPQLTELGVGLGAQYAVSSFTRTQETDADEVAVRYVADAGYNLAEGARSFAVLRSLYGDQAGLAQFFATHPATAERQQLMTRAAARLGATQGRVAQAEYAAAMRPLRQQALQYYEQAGRAREAAQIARNLRGG